MQVECLSRHDEIKAWPTFQYHWPAQIICLSDMTKLIKKWLSALSQDRSSTITVIYSTPTLLEVSFKQLCKAEETLQMLTDELRSVVSVYSYLVFDGLEALLKPASPPAFSVSSTRSDREKHKHDTTTRAFTWCTTRQTADFLIAPLAN